MATTDWLLLRIPSRSDGEVCWAVADSSGQLLSMPSTDIGGGFHTVSTGKRVALLVPGAEVSQFLVALPAGNEAKLLQLAPFALEDQVSQDVEQLHFAVGVRDAAGQVPVAVADSTQMQEWLARATELQLIPHAVFAESDLAPVLPGHVTMVVAEDQLMLRNDLSRPLLLPAGDPALALEMLLGTADFSSVNLAIYSTPQDWQTHGDSVEALRERVASFNVQLSAGGLLALFAQGLAHASPINLLQGGFRPQRSTGAAWQQWRWVAALAGALFLLHALGSFWQLHQVNAASEKTHKDMVQLYNAVYPGQSPGAQPRRAMQKRLEALSGGGQQGELMPLLAAVAAAKQNVAVASLQSATFEKGALKLRVSAPDAATIEQFGQALRAGGYTAKVTSSSMRDDKYEGQLEVKGAGT